MDQIWAEILLGRATLPHAEDGRRRRGRGQGPRHGRGHHVSTPLPGTTAADLSRVVLLLQLVFPPSIKKGSFASESHLPSLVRVVPFPIVDCI